MDKIIRERAESNEKLTLSGKACLSSGTAGRAVWEEECAIRTCFQRDRDRIIHCESFRRLKHKTQVFLSPNGDHYRTRLTHTLEVSQIARTIARALRLNEDLTEAIALGHDLGHTPFGHAGERALDHLSSFAFRHYEQSVRVVNKIEKNGAGLNLTAEVINGIGCHTKGEKAFTLEGQVIRLADRIAYINHDIDDAARAGIMCEEDIPSGLRKTLGSRKSERINRLVFNTVENSTDEIKMSREFENAFSELHCFMNKKVYTSDVCRKEDEKAEHIIERLYRFFIRYPENMPQLYKNIAAAEGADRAVCDYIAGMSDTYALETYSSLFIPQFRAD
ncbi:MAG: deoxyguanosinetriphosphate triphosphohydrolase [Eubacterium sp.]